MRDFSPQEMAKRNYIFNTIEKHFKRFGFEQIETPAMENRETLTGKYGEEGDRLIFNVLRSGDYLSKVSGNIGEKKSTELTDDIADKALRYDLTVPFARYVVQHQNEIAFPFRRYQIQPVWRADRPQKGRYREFYQCDADIIGSDSLLNELDLILLFDRVLSDLGLKDFTIKFNHRKLLNGLAEMISRPEKLIDITVAIDKLDKIGEEKVKRDLAERGLSETEINKLQPLFELKGDKTLVINSLKELLKGVNIGEEGIAEVEELLKLLSFIDLKAANMELDISLARGLDYYTGCIFEVVSNEVEIGSICGGGRYDDLTGIFGLSGMSGVGISFGADRIYDVMQALDLFPDELSVQTEVLIINFGKEEQTYALNLLQRIRAVGVAAEIYPDSTKLKKQFKYADHKKIPYVLLLGEEEIKSNSTQLKEMKSGKQEKLSFEQLIEKLKHGKGKV